MDAETILEGNAIFTEFKGALTEQYVLQEMITETSYTLYYFATDTSTYEIDFVIQKQKDVIPVEVKAETNLQAQSLKAYYKKFAPVYAIRTSMADYRDEEWLINLPLYVVRNL